ncbi:hypothetical protein HWD03_gp121 [Alteromonas phage vB_AmeM_PT11-V22]|uniref:Uncharacterized protein n=1 Tax=Alteromonas phage vB_AmeM_PT11-V22 TaxID=2704031 RepID=A0A6C0R328_9CAUD|nr:hypothetical protein HWD03_gp121 [Alteromonas phage vB_AmeM_PT11-V22]QHZ59852.1 hypothetical protein [Alteromonas phage vB_AmeM_PT11-V22]
MDNKTYWSDGKSEEDIMDIAATDSYTCVIYNLHEDTLCMREEIEQITEQLAKANERVKELELLIVAITHADETGYVDGVGFVEGWSEVCDETKQLLNKFALEQQIKAVDALNHFLLNEYDFKGDYSFGAVGEAICAFGMQLRKDQGDDNLPK